MEKILNQEEIDALVRAARGAEKRSTPEMRELQVTTCDFRAAGQLAKHQVAALTQLHESFARNLSYSLGAYLGVGFEVAVVSVEQLDFREFLQRVPELAYFATLRVPPIHAVGIAQVEMCLTLPMIDLLLGGRGRPQTQMRDLTEIEEAIYQSVVELILRELSGTWQPLALGAEFDQRQPQSNMAHIFGASERVLSLTFEMRMPDVRGSVNIVLPAVAANLLLRALAQRSTPQKQAMSAANVARLSTRLLGSRFPVELALEAYLPARTLLELAAGGVIPFGCSVTRPVQLLVNERPLFAAHPARRGALRAAFIEQPLYENPQAGAGETGEGQRQKP